MRDTRHFMKNSRGSVTLEAAVALPVFICVILSLTYLIRIVHVNEKIGYALNMTANEMAALSYLYRVSGLEEFNESAGNTIDDIVDSFMELITESRENGFRENGFIEELKAFLKNILREDYEDLKTDICIPVVKLYLGKFLPGFPLENLDFSHSSFFEDDSGEIDIIARYSVDIPFPVKVFPGLILAQRVVVKSWTGEEEKSSSQEDDENIWSLSNFERGRKVREIFGANLPYNFPVLSRFENGIATVIKSMDITAHTYKNPEMVIMKINEYVDNLAQYRGQEIPWGSGKIQIMEKDIKCRELLLVIPSNEIPREIESALEFCVIQSGTKGVLLKIERYGYSYKYLEPSKESN